MNYHARLNLIMITTVVGLALFLLFKQESQIAPVFRLSELSVDAVKEINIVRREGVLTLKKQHGHWYLTEPAQARADETKINQLLRILSSESNHRLALDNLVDFGLDKPNIQLFINDERFDFGGLTPITNEQYVAVGENIYLISPRHAVMLPSQPSQIISTKLLADTEIPIGFELNDWRINQHEGEWVIHSDKPKETLSQEEITHWVQSWQLAEATHLYMNAEGLEVGNDQQEIKISLQNGQQIGFGVQQNESGVILLRMDEGVRYLFPGDLGKSLLDPFDAEPI